MQQHKLDNFERQHGAPFPHIKQLSSDSCACVSATLRERLNLPPDATDLEVVTALDRVQSVVEGVNALADGFDLYTVLPPKIAEQDAVLINWYRFDQIDRVDLRVLVALFSDFWYPGADDIDIVDEAVSAVVSISHDGDVKRILFTT